MTWTEVLSENWPLIGFLALLATIIIIDKVKKRKERAKHEEALKQDRINAMKVASSRAPPDNTPKRPVDDKEMPVPSTPPPVQKPIAFDSVFTQKKEEKPDTKKDLYTSVEKINELIKQEDQEAHERINNDIANLAKEFKELEAHKARLEKYGEDLVKVYKSTEERLNQLGATLYSLQKLDRNLETKESTGREQPRESDYYDHGPLDQEPLPSPQKHQN